MDTMMISDNARGSSDVANSNLWSADAHEMPHADAAHSSRVNIVQKTVGQSLSNSTAS